VSIRYAWVAGADDQVCIVSPTNVQLTVCGHWISYLPEVSPVFPHRVHDVCERLWTDGGLVSPKLLDVYVTCPVCGGEAPLDGVAVGAHPAWVVGSFGVRPGDEPCAGAGMEPIGEDPS
jgi:hypothetical protein